ncbi:hypothetical protein JC795_01785 [Pseudomonas veronii]|uniref:hypothetical protein n=1 Tax=Pseudomonas veronii TaxID=76761 RepID=UPI0018E73705|nr:hypothetical protein [Pseudomonas veronii]MBJ2176917.1 hypothetical protein [Pseudomonas veronii]
MAKNKSFEDFVAKHSTGSETPTFDPEKEIQEWQVALDSLYALIESFVLPYKEAGSVALKFVPTTLHEESLGAYKVNKGVLTVGNAKYILAPVGTMLIGSKGRVDVLGPTGTGMLALVRGDGPKINVRVTIGSEATPSVDKFESEKSKLPWKWKVVSNKPPYTYMELTENNFLSLLMELAA